MGLIRSVTVYCSSSRHVAKPYFDAAAELGTRIARQKWRLVYGGNNIGCMGKLADAARAAQGRVIGITPLTLARAGIADKLCDELVVTEGVRERKALMESRGDAFIALPGGLGTLEEIFEILVGKTLNAHNKPIVLLNISRFYDPLLAMIDHSINEKFVKPRVRDLIRVSATIDEAMTFLIDYSSPAPPGVQAPGAVTASATPPVSAPPL